MVLRLAMTFWVSIVSCSLGMRPSWFAHPNVRVSRVAATRRAEADAKRSERVSMHDAAHLGPAATDLLPSRASTRGSFWRVFGYFAQGSVLSPARRRGRFAIV